MIIRNNLPIIHSSRQKLSRSNKFSMAHYPFCSTFIKMSLQDGLVYVMSMRVPSNKSLKVREIEMRAARRIVRGRREKGWSQDELARRVGMFGWEISRQSVQKYETGRVDLKLGMAWCLGILLFDNGSALVANSGEAGHDQHE